MYTYIEQHPTQGVCVCDHADCVINQFFQRVISVHGGEGDSAHGWAGAADT